MLFICIDCIFRWLHDWSQTITGFGSILISILLAVLYYRQQKELSANHKGILEVTAAEWDRNEVTAKISNYGNGTVNALCLQTLAYTESGEHRKYSIIGTLMTREDREGGGWASAIRPDEEGIPFKATSKVGSIRPGKPPEDRYGIQFGLFMSQMAAQDVEEIKFLHVIRGYELSGNRCLATVQRMVVSVDAQNFGQQNSMSNLPNPKIYSRDDTFEDYLNPSNSRKAKDWLYSRGLQFISWLFFFLPIEHRPTNISGRGRVDHAILWRKIGYYVWKFRHMMKFYRR